MAKNSWQRPITLVMNSSQENERLVINNYDVLKQIVGEFVAVHNSTELYKVKSND